MGGLPLDSRGGGRWGVDGGGREEEERDEEREEEGEGGDCSATWPPTAAAHCETAGWRKRE